MGDAGARLPNGEAGDSVRAAMGATHAAARRDRGLWSAGLVGIGLLAAWLHWRAGYVFPWPWPDESHFITPALGLSELAWPAMPQLNAPEGIFWIPSGWYVAQVPFLWTGGAPLEMGRLLALAGVVTFAGTMATVAARAGAPRVICLLGAAVWICQPRVVAAANIARMEGLLLGVAGVVAWLVSTDRWPLAICLAWLAPLLHPIGLVIPVAVCAGALLRAPGRPWSALEVWLLAGVAVVWVAEVAHFLRHAEQAAAHIQFQLDRKLGRAITFGPWHRNLLAAGALACIAGAIRWRRATGAVLAAWFALALGAAFVIVEVVGRELWYEVLGRETAAALFALGVVVAIPRLRAPGWLRRICAGACIVLLVVATAAGLRETLVAGWYGMRPDPASRADWGQFVAASVAALRDLDAAATEGAVVVVDPNSGFGPEVFSRDWQHLVFVQPTPATPMETTAADYVLTTPGAPSVTREVAEQWGARPPDVQVRSPAGAFGMDLFVNPAIATP